jgi:chromosome partition protein MukB
VVVEEALGIRISRAPDQPTLGRRARELRVAELRKDAVGAESERVELRRRLASLEETLRASADLRSRIATLVAGDPAEELGAAREEAAAAAQDRRESLAVEEQCRESARALASRVVRVQQLLGFAHLLDPPDRAEEVRRLDTEREAAVRAGAEVARTRQALATLRSRLDELRSPPPSVEEVAALREQVKTTQERRQSLFHAHESLAFVAEHREALGWAEAAGRLEQEERELVPELVDVERQAREAAGVARRRSETADAEAQGALKIAQDARALALGAAADRDRALRELAELDAGRPSEGQVEAALASALEAKRDHQLTQEERDASAGELATCKALHSTAARDDEEAAERLTAQESEARPQRERWERLERAAEESRALGTTSARRFLAEFRGLGSPNLSTRARSAGVRLAERLRPAQRANDVVAAVQEWITPDEDRSADGYLALWLKVLDWVRRRLPAQLADLDDPLAAMRRLDEELALLEDRLKGQEALLRGTSEDVANTIETQIRRAVGQVQRLNQHLGGVAFGSIGGIRVRLRHLESMSRILRALREGGAQELLFDPGMAIEDALDELFRRYGGAGAGGQRLLDYREYIELHAEIKRRASPEWETASATKLSTGEAIGVGAAVMMVVLAEWERDANLLRGKRAHGSLRFLFLDEANRLDPKSLDEVFDLCRTLELQLLIAAPEVERAAGTTTYHLARVVDGGDERVLVTGRRTRATS